MDRPRSIPRSIHRRRIVALCLEEAFYFLFSLGPRRWSFHFLFQLLIVAWDSGNPEQVASAILKITVIRNEFAPTFSRVVDGSVSEHDPVGTNVTSVTATDQDVTVSLTTPYFLQQGYPVNAKRFYNICTTLDRRRRMVWRCTNAMKMFCVCWVGFARSKTKASAT